MDSEESNTNSYLNLNKCCDCCSSCCSCCCSCCCCSSTRDTASSDQLSLVDKIPSPVYRDTHSIQAQSSNFVDTSSLESTDHLSNRFTKNTYMVSLFFFLACMGLQTILFVILLYAAAHFDWMK